MLSIEPGLSYDLHNFQLNLNMPFALVRNRTQSVPDMETEAMTGEPRHGDAAFADFLLSFGLTYRFGGKRHADMDVDPIKSTNQIDLGS